MRRSLTALSAMLIALTTLYVPASATHAAVPSGQPAVEIRSTEAGEPSAAASAPNYRKRGDVPDKYKWNLESIYPSQTAWEQDCKKVEALLRDFNRFRGHLKNPAQVKAMLDNYAVLSRTFDKVHVYAKLSFDTNTGDSKLQALNDRAEKLATLVGEKTSWVMPELCSIPEAEVKTIFAAPELAAYKPFLEDAMKTKPHTLSQEMEAVLAQTHPMAKAPEKIYTMLQKDILFPTLRTKDGHDIHLTPGNYSAILQQGDRELRKSAYELYNRVIEHYQDTYASMFAGEVQANNFAARVHKYDSALEASLLPNGIPTDVYDQLLNTVHKNLPLLQRYMNLKKQLLGVDQLHVYDLYLPISANDQRYIPFEEAKGMVLEGLKPLGDDYVNVLKQAFDSNWIDVYSTENKRGGGYQWGCYDTHPFVLLNYQGHYDDVSTVAHELGHAMQSYYTQQKQPYLYSGYPIFTAEVASTMNETLMFKSLYKHATTRDEKMYLLHQYLETFVGTLFRQAQFAEFEKLAHEKEQKGEALTAETLKTLYLDIHKKYFGNTLAADPEVGMQWSRVPHFYYGFYVYQYATSFAASTALAKQILDEGEPAVQRVRENFLAAGSSKPPLEILKDAGVDMSTPKPIEQAMKVFEEQLNEMEKLMKQK
ncbi:oligoendopeptidase F [Tumebacillus flagellatus]|uniref:Oligopeptidase F n=1 Tax=Tumebacillus flagellatus TaxID=1157490 RepID=A0A074LVQ6_9BACL|nr:oligoendopeptidase F [Tumebacillus flagellatus]KEO84620.1 oligoendopeptidase F [Tumebacillus flagellatus]